MGSPKKIEAPQYPFLVKQGSSMCFDEWISKPNNNVMISNEKFQIIRDHSPSSSSSSSSPPPLSDDLKVNRAFTEEETANYFLHGYKTSPLLPPAEDFALQEFVIRNGGAGGNYQDYTYGQNVPTPLMPKVDDHMVSNWQQQDVIMPMPVQAIMGSNFQIENKIMDVDYNLNKFTEKTSDLRVDESERKTNKRDEVMAKTIERRRRRMIKNRESAARSRARKQAYTTQLQHNVSHLQTTNKLLRKRKEVEKMLDSNSSSEPRHQLRRTSSAEF